MLVGCYISALLCTCIYCLSLSFPQGSVSMEKAHLLLRRSSTIPFLFFFIHLIPHRFVMSLPVAVETVMMSCVCNWQSGDLAAGDSEVRRVQKSSEDMHMSAHAGGCPFTHTCTHAPIHTHARTHAGVHSHTHMCAHTCTHTHMHVHMCPCACTHTLQEFLLEVILPQNLWEVHQTFFPNIVKLTFCSLTAWLLSHSGLKG